MDFIGSSFFDLYTQSSFTLSRFHPLACTHMHTHICIHTYAHTHMHTHTYAYTHMHTHVCTHTYAHTHMHTHICVNARMHTYAHTHICINARIMQSILSRGLEVNRQVLPLEPVSAPNASTKPLPLESVSARNASTKPLALRHGTTVSCPSPAGLRHGNKPLALFIGSVYGLDLHGPYSGLNLCP